MYSRYSQAYLLLILLVSACYGSYPGDEEARDASTPPVPDATDDAGPPPNDAATGVVDAATGVVDAAVIDAGAIDAGAVDAGPPCSALGPERLDVSNTHSCYIDDTCALYCWGSNARGQLGQGDTEPSSVPTRFDDESWRAVAVWPGDEARTCGIRSDGSLWCAGRALDRTIVDDLSPRLWHAGPWVALSLTDTFNGIKADGSLWAFGPNFRGAVGRGGEGWACNLTPSFVAFTQIAEGPGWTGLSGRGLNGCALRGGERWCWGHNGDGQLGLGDTEVRCAPTRVGDAVDWQLMSTGSVVCGIRVGGALFCSGHNIAGQVDPALDTVAVTTLTPVMADEGFISVSNGNLTTCAVRDDHKLFCWGSNTLGLLGEDLPAAHRLGPVEVGAGLEWDFVRLDTQGYSACAQTMAGELYCWGYNANGELGTGDMEPRTSPTLVPFP
jgi:hypothetical protein